MNNDYSLTIENLNAAIAQMVSYGKPVYVKPWLHYCWKEKIEQFPELHYLLEQIEFIDPAKDWGG